MGLFDTIEVKCLSCGKFTHPQTKRMGDCTLEVLKTGHKIDSDEIEDCNLWLKNSCEHCNSPLVLEIRGGRILKLTKEKPNWREISGGTLEKV